MPTGNSGRKFSDADFDRARQYLKGYIVACAIATGAARQLGEELARAVIADFDGYVVPALLAGKPPRHFFMTDFSSRTNWSRQILYDKKLKPWIFLLEIAAAAIPLSEHAQLTDGQAHCLIEQTTSPVGDNASGPGVWPPNASSRKKTERLFGSMFTGHGVHLYTSLASPQSADLHPTDLAAQAAALTEPWGAALAAIRAMADLEPERLERLGLDPQRLREYHAPDTLLLPRLNVGLGLAGGIFQAISPDPTILAKALQARSNRFLRKVVVECLGDWEPEGPLEWLKPDEILGILGWSYVDTPFDPAANAIHGEYALDRTRGAARLHRKVRDGDHASDSMVALNASFVLIGFDFRADYRRTLIDAIRAIEELASRSPAAGCALAFGEDFAPARTGPRDPTIRSFIFLVRCLACSALTIVARRSDLDER